VCTREPRRGPAGVCTREPRRGVRARAGSWSPGGAGKGVSAAGCRAASFSLKTEGKGVTA
jgi:hypothetical protein